MIFRRRFLLFLAILLLLVVACKKREDSRPAKTATAAAAERPLGGDYGLLRKKLNDLAPRTHIYAYEDLAGLVPQQLTAHVLINRPQRNGGYQIPDKRINPAEVRFLLAPREGYFLDMMRFGDPPLWKPIVSYTSRYTEVVLLERADAVEAQVELPLSVDRFRRELGQMIKVRYKSTPAVGEQRGAAFFIDRYEVTNAQYAYFLNDIGILYDEANVYYSIKDPVSKIVFLHGLYRFYRGTARYPVFNVSYYGAKAFCERYGRRLATTDEWREAIGYRKDHRDFPWGADRDFERRANFLGDQDGYRLWAPVDAFPDGRSPYGVYNMAGNMWEWLDRSVIMGGAWDFPPEPYGRVSFTDDNAPYARNTHDGFRCVSDRKISN